MYVVIAGGGVGGAHVGQMLANRKDDVVIIEQDQARCEKLYAETGIISINGGATDILTLKEAGIERADVAIGTLYKDSDNLTFALLAHSLGVPKIMAKMRHPDYAEAYRFAGVTTICNMIELFQNKIIMELENPNIQIITQIKGDTLLIMAKYPTNGPVDGISIVDLSQINVFSHNCVFAGILNEKTGKIIMPRGHDLVFPGDRLFLVVNRQQIPGISHHLRE